MANATVATYPGRTIFNNRLKGSGTEPKNLGWGDMPQNQVSGAQIGNVNLWRPSTEARTAGVSTLMTAQQLGDAYQVTGLITNLVGAKTIMEAGLFDTTTLSQSVTITASLTAAATTVSLSSVASLPQSGAFYAQIASATAQETVLAKGSAASPLSITRAQLASVSAIHGVNAAFTIGDDGGAAVTGGTNSGQSGTVGATAGGAMFAHADFGGIVLAVNDGINFTWQVTLT